MDDNPGVRKNLPTVPVSRQNKWIHLGVFLLVLLASGLLSGCADHSAKNKELLSQNYLSLADDDLTLYYYELEDQITITERKRNRSSISLGLGMGSYGSSGGHSGGVGVTTSGDHSDVATNLRDRRNQVKLEMQKRDLKP